MTLSYGCRTKNLRLHRTHQNLLYWNNIILYSLGIDYSSYSYSLGIEYSSYSISKLLQVFASENVFRAQVLGSIPEQLEEVYQTR